MSAWLELPVIDAATVWALASVPASAPASAVTRAVWSPFAVTFRLRAPSIVTPAPTDPRVVYADTLAATERPTPWASDIEAAPWGSALTSVTVVLAAAISSSRLPTRVTVAPAAM